MDDWIEIEPEPTGAKRTLDPVTISVRPMGRGKVPKVSFTIDERLLVDVGWPRFRVAFNRDRKQFRIAGDPMGRHEARYPPNIKEGTHRRAILTIPVPVGLVATGERLPAAYEVNRQDRSMLVRVPSRFWEKRP